MGNRSIIAIGLDHINHLNALGNVDRVSATFVESSSVALADTVYQWALATGTLPDLREELIARPGLADWLLERIG